MRILLIPLLIALLGPFAEAAPKPTSGLRYASLTPDGKSVVFCYRGDIWSANLDGSQVDRLTIHEAQDTLARVSPDGKQIAFSSRRNGNYDLFVIPITGGLPKRITFHSGYEALCDWSPDGKKLLFVSERDGDTGRSDLYEVTLEGGTPRRVTFDGAREGAYSPDGKTIAYVRGFLSIYWDNYEGSANFDIYTVPSAGGTPRRMTHTAGNERWPYYSADGKTIAFVAEEKGVANFYAMPSAGGKRSQLSHFKGTDVHRPDLAADYKQVVFERAGKLFTMDLFSPKAKAKAIPISIQSDVRNSGVVTRTITSGGEHVHVSYDGREAAFALRGDIWVMPAAGGSGRRITSGPAKDEWPRFSPNGKWIAFQSNRSGNNDIWLLDRKSGKKSQLTRSRANDFFFNWSPDSSQLVFCSERSGNRDIWLIDVKTRVTKQLTNNPAGDDDPSFSPDGKQIAFDSARGGGSAIYVMNVDGSGARQITSGAGFLQVPSFSPDGKLLVYEGFIPQGGRSGGLFVVSANGGQSMRISSDGQTACWRGDYIYFTANRRRAGSGVFRVKGPKDVMAGERVPFIGSVDVDLKRELGNLFDECWSALRDGFYDRKMHGVKWTEMRKKYRDMAVDSENKDEFHNIVRQMLAELGASHLGIFGGTPTGNSVAPKIKATGYLGLEFEPVPEADGTRKVNKILAGGPADRAGIRVGDVVTKIGASKLRAKTNLDKVMTGTVDKTVPVTYKPRSADGLGLPRTTPVKPIAFSDLRKLKSEFRVKTCARRVKDATKKSGEAAYVHLSSMNPQNLAKFQKTVLRINRSKTIKGLVLDIRENGGGNIHNQLMRVLWAKPLARVRVRNGPEAVQPTLYWDKPIVLLINERSFSDAEVFPYMYKKAGIGKIVGVPTPGGVIGTNNITLSDGTTFRVPRTGFKGMDGTNLEGLGVKPDFIVEETTEDRLAGRDPQLAKAIEIIKDEIAERAKKQKQKKKKKKKKPVTKKPEKTAPEPAPVKPVAAEIDPLLDAREGEWVRYRYREPGTDQDTIFKVSISKVGNGIVTFLKEIETGGPNLPPIPDQLKQATLLDTLKNFGKLNSHTIVDGKVAEKDARVLMAELAWPDGSILRMAFANEIPVYGLLRIEYGKQVMLEAIEWSKPIKDPAKAAEETAAPAEALPKDPLYDAKEGEWVRFKRFGPQGQEVEMKMTVTEVSDDEIVMKRNLVMQGRTIPAGTQRRPREEILKPPGGQEAKSYGSEEIKIGGRTFKCITMTASGPRGGEVKWYICPDVAVGGLVRKERDGKVLVEIIEWGEGDG